MSDPATSTVSGAAPAAGIEMSRTIAGIRERIAGWRADRCSIGLIMTMGALHEGHLSLVHRSIAENDRTIVTVFANPLQLVGEDFVHYPRREDADVALVADAGADVLWTPAVEEMFPGARKLPEDFLTVVRVKKLTDRLCARTHAGLYEGIATEILKTIIIMLPDVSYWGQKDFQQLQMVRRLFADLNVPGRVVEVPTLRMPDGLPYASRNFHLTPETRAVAPEMYRTLSEAAQALADPEQPTAPVTERARRRLVEAGFDPVDYVEVCDEEELQPLERVDRPARVFGAGFLGRARMVDNIPVPRAPAG
jgi:pantoate--beta-alanine ligase